MNFSCLGIYLSLWWFSYISLIFNCEWVWGMKQTMDACTVLINWCVTNANVYKTSRYKSGKMYSFLEHTEDLYSLQFYICIHRFDIIYFEYKIFSSIVLSVSVSLSWSVGDHNQFYSAKLSVATAVLLLGNSLMYKAIAMWYQGNK
jgi:hypothetical protein